LISCSCGFIGSERRALCPRCGSRDLKEFDPESGVVVETWKLNVTPEGLEESYYLVLAEVKGVKIILTSTEPVQGEVIIQGGKALKRGVG
jgi:uncharacterized OB-fold protein